MRTIFALICAATMVNALAQQPGAVGIPSPYPGQVQLPKRPDPVRMKLNFDGGSPEDLLARIKEASGARPNVIIHPGAANANLPAFSLQDVTAGQIFNALNMLGEPGEGPIWQPVNTQDGEIWTLMPARRAASGIDPLTGVPMNQGQFSRFQRQAAQSRECRIFNLTAVLDDYTVEDVTTAVKGAWELMNSGEEPTVKYHKDTKLLIVVGDSSQLTVVSQVITELSNNVRLKRSAAAKSADPTKAEQPQPNKQ